jgi:hypothetical protein
MVVCLFTQAFVDDDVGGANENEYYREKVFWCSLGDAVGDG